jgi:hypothetical protein
MKFLLATIGLAVLLLCIVSPAVGQTGPNLVVNGSFETDPCTGSGQGYKLGLVGTAITGWVIQTTDGTYPWCLQNTNAFGAGPAADGNQWLVLGEVFANTSRTIQQTLTGLNPGGTYKLTFAIASELGCCSVAEVSFPSGSSTAAQTFTAPGSAAYWKVWGTQTMNFVAASSSVTLQFKNLVSAQTGPAPNGDDLGLDNVSVVSVSVVQNQATNGAQLTINGMLSGASPVPVFATITDSQIHSNSFHTVAPGTGEDNCTVADEILTDAYILQGGSPSGCDPGNGFEGALGTGSANVSGFAVTTKYVVWTAGPAVCNTNIPPHQICIGADNPSNDTSFMTVTNNTGQNFTGTIGVAGTALKPSTCLPSGAASDSKTFNSDAPFLPGASWTFAISTDASACGGLQPTQIAPPQTVAAGGTNPVVFSNAINKVVQHNVTWAGNLTPQNGVTNPQLSSENIILSTDPTIAAYVALTPWAVAQLFEKAGDNQVAGGTGFGSIYRDKCFQAGQDPSTAREQDCPIGTGPTDFTNFSDTFDQPTKQDIAPGTTVSLIHHPGTAQTGPQPTDSWLPVPSGALVNPVCKQVQTSASGVNFDCELADDLIYDPATISPNSPGGVSGDQTTIGGKRGGRGTIGSFFMVPMLQTAVKVNTTPVNTILPEVQGTQQYWFNSHTLNLDFLVNPAQASSPSNGWFAAPPNTLAYILFSNSTPEPPLPNPPNCVAPATTACHATSGTPGAFNSNGVAASVDFMDSLTVANDGLYTLAWSACDTVKICERNIQLLHVGSNTPCPPNPYSPLQVISHPCYSTTLFGAQIGFDTIKPKVTGLTLSTTMPTPGQVTASYTCTDELSGIASCGTGPQTFTRGTLNTGTLNNTFNVAGKGPQSYSVTATDLAGNNSDPTSINYTVVVPDVNNDGSVGCDDLTFVKKYFGTKVGQPGYNASADVNGDGVVNVLDLSIVARHLPANTTCP